MTNRFAIIEDGLVVNVVVGQPAVGPNQQLVECLNAGPGWKYLDGVFSPPEVSQEVLLARLKDEVIKQTQTRLDAFAQTRNYDSMFSLCTYATSTNDKFKAEGQYGVEARDATWAKLYEMMAEVSAGTRPMPSGYTDVESELPALVWPDEAPTA